MAQSSKLFLYLYIISLISGSVGFYNFIWFVSVGYGISVFTLGFSMLILIKTELTLGTILLCLILILYGIRLTTYLLKRDFSSNYKQLIEKTYTSPKLFVKIMIWITCSLLYPIMISPVFYRLVNKTGSDFFTYFGVIVSLFGIGLEALADKQKFEAKKIDPKRWCDTGLYKIVRCPNYLGEIIFWTGIIISGVNSLYGFQWFVAIIGYISIVLIMFGGAKRLEIRQTKNYWKYEEYQKYFNKTPIIIPGIPLYSLAKYTWIKK